MASVVEDVQLVGIAGHRYRQRTQPIIGSRNRDRAGTGTPAAHTAVQDWQVEEELEILTLEDEQIDDSLISQEGDSHVTHLSVDAQLLPFIIGRGGNSKKQIEQETGATLIIPKGTRPDYRHAKSSKQQLQQQQVLGSSQSETLTIKGSSKQAVSSARVRTQLLIDSVLSSRMLEYTHFVSIPLANAQTAEKLQEFQQQVLSQPDAAQQGFDPSIFINPQCLHLTLLMLKLYSDEARHKAAQALHGMQPEVQKLLGGQPLRLSLKGLDYMSDDPTDMHVLYLKVNEVGQGQKLSGLCDVVVRAFEEAGLMLPGQSKQVKLHATIINTRHRRLDREQQQQQQQQQQQEAPGRHRRQQPDRQGFNGQKLLQDWKDIDLGEYRVPAVHISQRSVYDPQSGFYACFDSLNLQT